MIQHNVQNIPLLPIAYCSYGFGLVGLGYLWSKFRDNYVWLLTHIFLLAHLADTLKVSFLIGVCIDLGA